MSRNIKAGPRTFEQFPADVVCPVCNTNDDGMCVLVPVKGTASGGIVEAQPMHLACAVIQVWDRKLNLGWTVAKNNANEEDEDGVRRFMKAQSFSSEEVISDGFGSSWSRTCPTCKQKTMEIVRPGKVQCCNCG